MNGKTKQWGQAVIELAIFGGIVIFLIGGIVRSAISSSYQQNDQLKAMRMALLQSYRTSMLQAGVGRNSASVLFIEDRLSPEVSRYGSQERTPYVHQGGGTLSNMLMFPVDVVDLTPGYQQNKNISMMDMFINGKQLTLSTSRASGKDNSTGTDVHGLGPPSGFASWYANGTVPDPANNGTRHYKGWNFMCVEGEIGGVLGMFGCPIFYQIVINPGDRGILTPEESFNLRRSDDFDDNPPPTTTASPDEAKIASQYMAWQWKGFDAVRGRFPGPDEVNSTYPSYDVDNDLHEETVYIVNYDINGIVTSLGVLDYQDGDIDGTYDTFTAIRNNNGVPVARPGLQSDMGLYTQANPGTFLQIKEGKLFNPEDGSFVRSTNRKDRVDLVERLVQLSNNTLRLCDSGVPNIANGVQACNNCFSPANRTITCFDEGLKMLYVRSNIWDKRGRFWRTSIVGGLP